MADTEVSAPAARPAAAEKKSRGPKKAVPKGPRAKKAATGGAAKKAKSVRTYPSFAEMISDAIVTQKERNGSSQYAITKFIEEKHKNLPSNFRKLLLVHLKKLVASDKLVKVKNSFKLPSSAKKKPAADDKKVSKPKVKVAAVKPKAAKTAAVGAARPKAKAAATAKPKPKTSAKLKPKSPVKAVKAKAKAKAAPVKKSVRKPKSVKSPAKKKTKK